MSFSQSGEEAVVLAYFGDHIGRFLECGAWNGICMSNCHALALRGWGGCCVEPDPPAIEGLIKTYDGRSDIAIVTAALANFNGQTEFHSSGGGGISTTSDAHRAKWETQAHWRTMYVDCLTPAELLRLHPGPYDMLSLDVEGHSAELLFKFPLSDMKCDLVVVEHDGRDDEIIRYCDHHGLSQRLLRNNENWIIAR